MKNCKGKVVLVVDDEEVLREILKDEFERLGATVLEAKNGHEAFEIYNKTKVDVVISDIRMPDGDGIELVNNIRGSDFEMPVVLFMTGFSDVTLDGAYAMGVNAIFKKPFQLKEICKTIAQLLVPFNERFSVKSESQITQHHSANLPSIRDSLDNGNLVLGRGGVFIKDGVIEKLKLGTVEVEITFKTGQFLVLQFEGMIRWIRSIDDNHLPAGIGIEFVFLPDGIRQFFSEEIKQTNPRAYIPNGK